MSNSPPRSYKRRRLIVENFVDLEAGVSSDSETSSNEDDLIDAELQENEPELDEFARETYNHATLQRECGRVDKEFWDSFLMRAKGRSIHAAQKLSSVDEDERVGPGPTDKLWEVPCKIGHEEGAVFKLIQALMHSSAPVAVIQSAFARQSVPGRIFVESKTLQDVVRATSTISHLCSADIKPVTPDNMTNVLSMPSTPRPYPQDWVRILGNTNKLRPYKGDIALVVETTNSNLMQLWLVPRVQMDGGEPLDRPLARLLDVERIKSRLGSGSLREREGGIMFEKKEFSTQGYLVLHKQEMHVCYSREGIPTGEELEAFLGCEALLPQTLIKTRRRIEQTQLVLHDRVKFTVGTFCGLLGKVVSFCGAEVDVYLPSHDVVERVRLSEVVKHFKIGDRVRMKAGRGGVGAGVFKVGWVTKVEGSELTVFDTADGRELAVSSFQVEFYEDESNIHLRSAPSSVHAGDSQAMKVHPDKRLIGKRVLIIGADPYKGAKGTIRDVSLNREASVMLEIFNESFPRKFMLKNLCLVRGAAFVPFEGSALPIAIKAATPDPLAYLPPPSTPRPTFEEQSHEGDCWDPDTALPDANAADEPIPTWLQHEVFRRIRVKLHYRNQPSMPCLEFCGMEGALAKVREAKRHQLAPLSSLVSVKPTRANDLVTSFEMGSKTFGKLFKVREYSEDKCTLRGFGQKTGKGEKNYLEFTRSLAEVFPPLK